MIEFDKFMNEIHSYEKNDNYIIIPVGVVTKVTSDNTADIHTKYVTTILLNGGYRYIVMKDKFYNFMMELFPNEYPNYLSNLREEKINEILK